MKENSVLNPIPSLLDIQVDNDRPFSIEGGYFVFTLMPSLRCNLNCPHCYLSLEQRRNSEIMPVSGLKLACEKVDEYYTKRGIKDKEIVLYWYGGEPTQMGIDYMADAVDAINSVFTSEKGYTVKHTILTSLLNIDENIWFPFFRDHCNNYFQTSFDGLMRGKGYMRKWEQKVKRAIEYGLDVGTISVVNKELLKDGAKNVMEYLTQLRVREVSFLPFMWNEQNDGDKFNKFAPSMTKWNDFLIEVSDYYFQMKEADMPVPEIGQLFFILYNGTQGTLASIASQTLFLLPNGDFVLPDYRNKYQEYMRYFGNIYRQSFEQILTGKQRASYLRKQAMRNNNKECLSCQYATQCVMEFWKENREGDECFGGKRYIEWLMNKVDNNLGNFRVNVLY